MTTVIRMSRGYLRFLWLLALCLRRVHGDEGGLAVINCLDKGMEAFQFSAAANEWGMSEADQFDMFQMARVLRMTWARITPNQSKKFHCECSRKR